ncbi:MAG TPA: ribonuclease H-like domain-containing protein [Bacteroidota bacterium]|nr:ribonuclease H-like domain-containing protein [Bacteroidota bacterium]
MKSAETQHARETEVQKLSLSPLTAQIVAIGMLNPDTMAGKVLYQSAKQEQSGPDERNIEYHAGTEEQIVRQFWDDVRHYDQFITFNGRSFDCPFLMIRSAMLSIPPTRSLMPYRYDSSTHCDLLDQLTFYGAVRRFNLDFYCKSFGIKSPKSEGVSGLDIGPMFREGKFKEIAQYCAGDVIATAELFRKWDAFINIKA